MARFVLWGTYSADALEKRVPFRQEHLSRLQSLKDEGVLITLGPTEGSTLLKSIRAVSSPQNETCHSEG